MLLAAMAIAAPAAAQVDYHNLDHGRPTVVEDAYPIERYGFELSAGYRRAGPSGGARHLFEPELLYGLARGVHAALRTPFVVSSGGSGSPAGLAGIDLSVLLNLSTERVSRPGLAVRVDASLPAGAAGGHGIGGWVTGLATRSFGAERIHLNASVALDTPEVPGGGDHPRRWWVGMAVDRTLIRSSTLLVGEATVGSVERGRPLRYSVGAAIRRQVAPTLVADVGLGWEFARAARTETSLTFGLSHAFGFALLMPGRTR